MPLTAANSEPIQTSQVQGKRPGAEMLTRKPKKSAEPPEGTKHWSQKPSAAMLTRGRK